LAWEKRVGRFDLRCGPFSLVVTRSAIRRACGDAQKPDSLDPRRSPVMSSPLWQGHSTRMAKAAHETPANEFV